MDAFPNWLSVIRALHRLPDNSAITRDTFRDVGADRAWQWAVRNRGDRALGPAGPHPGPSPWLAFVQRGRAGDVRGLLPLWVTVAQLPALPASEFADRVHRDPVLHERYRVGGHIAEFLVRNPDERSWLRHLLQILAADPRRDGQL